MSAQPSYMSNEEEDTFVIGYNAPPHLSVRNCSAHAWEPPREEEDTCHIHIAWEPPREEEDTCHIHIAWEPPREEEDACHIHIAWEPPREEEDTCHIHIAWEPPSSDSEALVVVVLNRVCLQTSGTEGAGGGGRGGVYKTDAPVCVCVCVCVQRPRDTSGCDSLSVVGSKNM
jgi:hypothetical protein